MPNLIGMKVAEEVLLYDLQNSEECDAIQAMARRSGRAYFRSCLVYFCGVCMSRTNRWLWEYLLLGEGDILLSGPRLTVVLVCPNTTKEWHKEVKRMVDWLEAHPHPASYKCELSEEIVALIAKNDKDRAHDCVSGTLFSQSLRCPK